ncbi:hypothetical protein MPH47_18075 [Psychrobacillus psychrodurans]|jgi:hypothetical protein|uniref:hypothetical protein n=1 Tax=Psychrobacillus psychrodurans TaxID=126157 RepID=UPI001F4D6DAF|nr:hypothetical protein [Psychrobacillus psychrodurans]MCK1999106.1 hypothetical protein [Psychrobacillus psychrodurans]
MKKIFTGVLTLGLLLGGNTAFASENTLTNEEVDKILINFGYEKEELPYYFEQNKLDLAQAIQENPENVQKSTSYLRVDNIGLIEYYTNTSDQEILENASPENLKAIKEKLNKIDSKSVDELMKENDFSEGEAKLVKSALKKNPKYKAPKKFGKKEVTTSGEISSSDLAFTMSVNNKSTTTAPSYDVTLNHNWQNPYFFDIVKDNVAAAWGGNLDVKNISALVYYNKGNWYSGKYGAGVGSFAPGSTVSPNTGIVFEFDQSKQDAAVQAKSGNYWFTVFQNKKQGYSTTLVSQFAHKILTVSNVTVSNTPSIVIGLGKDESPQKKANINY